MPGPWNLTSPPPRPGGYTNWRASQQPVIPPTRAGIVCIPFTHDWGPFQIPTLANSWEQWQQQFGSDDTPGSRAVKMAFLGEGLPGYGGAGAVLSYRFGGSGSAAVAATVVLNKTGPTGQLRLTGKYVGTRANRLNVTVRTNASNAANQDLVIYDGATQVESYTYTTAPADATPMADLAAVINANSSFVTATVLAENAPLLNVSNAQLTGGTDGATTIAADWTAVLNTLQPERFAVFVPFDNTDSTVQASIVSWIQGLNNGGKRVTAFVGGIAGETAATAVARAAAINDPNINTLGIGSVVDYNVIGTPVAPVVLSTSQAAPRIAGIYAARGGVKPLTYGRLPGWDFRVVTPTGVVAGVAPSDADVVSAIAGGVISLSRDSNPASPLRIEKGVTTWQSTNTDSNRPYNIYKNPRYVKVMQDFEMAITEFIQNEILTPGLPMTQATKEFALGRAQKILQTMNEGGLIQTGYTVGFDTTIPSLPTDDFLAVVYQWLFTREVNQVRNTVVVG